MTCGAGDRIERPRVVIIDERMMSLIIKTGKTARIKINGTIVMHSKLANRNEFFL